MIHGSSAASCSERIFENGDLAVVPRPEEISLSNCQETDFRRPALFINVVRTNTSS